MAERTASSNNTPGRHERKYDALDQADSHLPINDISNEDNQANESSETLESSPKKQKIEDISLQQGIIDNITSNDKQGFWFLLRTAQGKPFKYATGVTKVEIAPAACIDDFRRLVKVEFNSPGYLKDIPASTLKVFENESNKEQLEATRVLNGMGKLDNPLWVLVPEYSAPPDVENSTGSNRSKRKELEETTVHVNPFDTLLELVGNSNVMPQAEHLGLLASTSSFKEIREKGLYYVDKTKLILDMVEKKVPYKHVFLSRPRRFGKTLVVSVLEHLFLGHQALFTGLYAEKNWEWKTKYPVLRFDFSGINPESFETLLLRQVLLRSEKWSFKNEEPASTSALEALVTDLYNRYHRPCVILVDEYDKPVLASFDLWDEVEATAHRNMIILGSFFEMIKSLGNKIHFSFVTGSSRLTRASVFSGDNLRQDVSFEAPYDAICGFTEAELEPFLVKSSLKLDELKSMYNGYQFGGDSFIYNPFCVVNAFAKNKIGSYWIESGSLANSILKFSDPGEILVILRNLDAEEGTDKSVVSQNYDVNVLLAKKVPLFDLLLQAGYLTLRIKGESWSLVIPNDEVKLNAIPELLRLAITRSPHSNAIAQAFSLAVYSTDMNKLYDEASKFLTSIAFPSSANESYYRSVLQAGFKLANGVACDAECQNAHGRADLVLGFNSGESLKPCKIIIELKLMTDPTDENKEKIHEKAGLALEQARKYSGGQGDVVIAGWIVNKSNRTLYDVKKYGDKCHRFEDLRTIQQIEVLDESG